MILGLFSAGMTYLPSKTKIAYNGFILSWSRQSAQDTKVPAQVFVKKSSYMTKAIKSFDFGTGDKGLDMFVLQVKIGSIYPDIFTPY
ncbi:hypothetical protein [Methanosarcina mazei]|uniref:hypothetical protein n=1 Tax=Methanosarcina mazei TaxID=2209 RepID=UPI002180655B|nr:hypothetical protein [Methanosarcina mazei]